MEFSDFEVDSDEDLGYEDTSQCVCVCVSDCQVDSDEDLGYEDTSQCVCVCVCVRVYVYVCGQDLPPLNIAVHEVHQMHAWSEIYGTVL